MDVEVRCYIFECHFHNFYQPEVTTRSYWCALCLAAEGTIGPDIAWIQGCGSDIGCTVFKYSIALNCHR